MRKDEDPLYIRPDFLEDGMQTPEAIGLLVWLADKTWGEFKGLKVSDLPLPMAPTLKKGSNKDLTVFQDFTALVVIISCDNFGVAMMPAAYQTLCDVVWHIICIAGEEGRIQDLSMEELIIGHLSKAMAGGWTGDSLEEDLEGEEVIN